jgi:hypothetical protein
VRVLHEVSAGWPERCGGVRSGLMERGFFGLGAVADRSGKEGRDILERLYWLVEAWFLF